MCRKNHLKVREKPLFEKQGILKYEIQKKAQQNIEERKEEKGIKKGKTGCR